MDAASDEGRRVDWKAFIEMTGNTPIEQADIVVNILEEMALSLCRVNANLRVFLFADDQEQATPDLEKKPDKSKRSSNLSD